MEQSRLRDGLPSVAGLGFDSRYLLSHFDADLNAARANYLEYTLDGLSARRPLDEVQHQLYLGEIPEVRNRKRNAAHLGSSEISRANKAALLPS
jgi:hypothetical protein